MKISEIIFYQQATTNRGIFPLAGQVNAHGTDKNGTVQQSESRQMQTVKLKLLIKYNLYNPKRIKKNKRFKN